MVCLSEGCLGARWRGVWTLDACYLGTMSRGEGMEMETDVPGGKVMEQGKQSEDLSLGRMSTAGGKERAAAAGGTAACPGSTMRLRDIV